MYSFIILQKQSKTEKQVHTWLNEKDLIHV